MNFEMFIERLVKQFFAFICVYLLIETFLDFDSQVLIGYIALLFMRFFSWQSGPITIIFSLLNWLPSLFLSYRRNIPLQIVSGCVVWSLINNFWLFCVGYNLPLCAWVISFLWMVLFVEKQYYELNDSALWLAQSEKVSILLCAIYFQIFIDFNWY
jgi:hypothetical protein